MKWQEKVKATVAATEAANKVKSVWPAVKDGGDKVAAFWSGPVHPSWKYAADESNEDEGEDCEAYEDDRMYPGEENDGFYRLMKAGEDLRKANRREIAAREARVVMARMVCRNELYTPALDEVHVS